MKTNMTELDKENVRCDGCGESWDSSTLGLVEAFEVLSENGFLKCPSCLDQE